MTTPNSLLNTIHLGEAIRMNSLKQEAVNIANSRNHTLEMEKTSLKLQLDEAKAALARANALVADWQSAMEAWKDLAVTLRDEIKACPNHEAHKFGKDDAARKKHIQSKEETERAKRGLKPKYAE